MVYSAFRDLRCRTVVPKFFWGLFGGDCPVIKEYAKEDIMNENEEQFQYWLVDMDDAIERFISLFPQSEQVKLDFTRESLAIVEEWILARYSDMSEVLRKSEAATVDGAARYVGEVFRKILGGKWFIDFSDPKNVYCGLPQIGGMRGQRVQFCPLTFVTTSVDRRTGNFMLKILDNKISKLKS